MTQEETVSLQEVQVRYLWGCGCGVDWIAQELDRSEAQIRALLGEPSDALQTLRTEEKYRRLQAVEQQS